jgi:hypothetical protein
MQSKHNLFKYSLKEAIINLIKIKCLQLVFALVIVCFRDDLALIDTALVNAASVKNDVYLWIYTMHTIKRHIVMI